MNVGRQNVRKMETQKCIGGEKLTKEGNRMGKNTRTEKGVKSDEESTLAAHLLGGSRDSGAACPDRLPAACLPCTQGRLQF